MGAVTKNTRNNNTLSVSSKKESTLTFSGKKLCHITLLQDASETKGTQKILQYTRDSYNTASNSADLGLAPMTKSS